MTTVESSVVALECGRWPMMGAEPRHGERLRNFGFNIVLVLLAGSWLVSQPSKTHVKLKIS